MSTPIEKHDAAVKEATDWFFENADAVFMVVRDGLTIRISPGWAKLLGWSEADALNRSIWDFVHPDDLSVVRAGVKAIMTEGYATYEHRVPTKEGDYLWMRVRAKRSMDGAGIAVLQDISEERRQASEKAQMVKANALLNRAARVQLWRYDPVSDSYDLNPDFSRAFGQVKSRDRESGPITRGRVAAADRAALNAAFWRGVETGEPIALDYGMQSRDGARTRQVRSAWTSIRQLPCGRHELVGMTQDLTELMTERDRALAGDRAKAEFLANISHELRTPMNGLMGALHLARRGDQEDREGLIDQALVSGHALTELLGDIVEFAEADRTVGGVERTIQSTRNLIEKTVEMNREQAAAKGIWLRFADHVDGHLLLDEPKVRRILSILIGNAVKFTATGGVDITGSLVGDDKRSRFVAEVRDTGPGLGAADREAIFACFNQADGSSTRQFGGAGLGLARARQLAQLMDGTIGCESTPGHGATFRLSLPTEIAAPEGLVRAQVPRPATGIRVLAVDDNPTNLKLIAALLSPFCAQIQTACDGAEAVAAAAGGGFDLVLMDIQMPGMDGVEATRRIRALGGAPGQVRIVALTANVMAQHRALYLAAGMDGCVAKPISPAALHAELAKLERPTAEAA